MQTLNQTLGTSFVVVTHDPQLAASLHEVISMVTAIRSTAAILVETDELEPEWRDRFNRNINEDSARLAESSLGLVTYLDKAQDTESTLKLPMDEFEAFLTEHGFHFPGLETGEVGVQDLITKSALLQSGASRAMAQSWLEQYKRDAQLIPLDAIEKVLTDGKVEPAMIARQLNVDLATAIRRIATLPTTMLSTQVGLVACDASGTLVMRKPVAGFSLPRTGAACSMWPLYRALNRPAVPLSQVIEQAGPNAARFIGYAIAQPVGAISFEDAPIFEAHMLIVPTSDTTGEAALVVGSSCRICPKQECIGRREKSIMLDGF